MHWLKERGGRWKLVRAARGHWQSRVTLPISDDFKGPTEGLSQEASQCSYQRHWVTFESNFYTIQVNLVLPLTGNQKLLCMFYTCAYGTCIWDFIGRSCMFKPYYTPVLLLSRVNGYAMLADVGPSFISVLCSTAISWKLSIDPQLLWNTM